MIKTLLEIRISNFKLFLFLPVLISACTVSKPVILRDNKITRDGLYSVNIPPGDWRYNSTQSGYGGYRSQTVRDTLLVLCPGPKVITISRSSYRPPLLENSKDQYDLGKVSLKYIEDYYKVVAHNSNYIIQSTATIAVGEINGVIIYLENVEELVTCDLNDNLAKSTKRKLLHKFVILNATNKADFPGALLNPKLVVLEYVSPPENFNDAQNTFDQMVQSFKFLAK